MRELAVAIQNENKNVSVLETIQSIKKTGFKNVFIQWYDEQWDISQEEQVNLCKQLGLNIIFAHLGYQNINSIWEDGIDGDRQAQRYLKNIKDCKEHGITLVILHLTGGPKPPKYNELGLNRIRKIIEYAKELGVKVAFENTRSKEHLEYVLNNIKEENVGICFDAGHYHVHFNDEFEFENYKDRIFAVHLHDNDKTDDLHLLPYDGTIDWKTVVNKLKECNYDGPVTLELCYRYDYLNISLDEFYKKGYELGNKLLELFDN